ncbi:response regulator transcription factor [Plasticicumulans sp.]|uniref:response regulator transcription factor n=1 Tax=Plasticicumulans sp. TaxID=2307179 RepID=UPI00321FADDB
MHPASTPARSAAVPARILLIDDHAVVRTGVRRMLESRGIGRVVAEADSGEQGYAYFVESPCDLVILDLCMPGRGGLETLLRLRQRAPLLPVLVFSMHEDGVFATQALEAGALGYVSKSAPPEELIAAVVAALAGRRYLSADIARHLALAAREPQQTRLDRLSPREFEIFRLLASGCTAQDIAARLKLSTKTVANYGSLIRAKLGVVSSAELARLAIRLGVVEA